VSDLDALGAVPALAFFEPAAKKRALVVFTDGEARRPRRLRRTSRRSRAST
jgi:hypothetical protein